ncbi:unnamed protein product [Durusdinium trenchii]|uniref:AprA-like MT2-like domain-containing protein n=1 Tax=Durusdinium trenchii TaxID=1381693 RepID=A0ABP0KMQ1_9DINO
MSLVAGGETIEGENVESPKTYFLNGALCQEKDVQAPRRNVAKLLGTSENGTARRLLLFDGQCRLCLGFVSIVVGRDSSDLFRFAPLQSDLGQEVLLSHGVPKDIDSVVLLRDGEVYTHSDAALEVLGDLDGLISGLWGLKIIPQFLRDAGYALVAKSRFMLLGHSSISEAADEMIKAMPRAMRSGAEWQVLSWSPRVGLHVVRQASRAAMEEKECVSPQSVFRRRRSEQITQGASLRWQMPVGLAAICVLGAQRRRVARAAEETKKKTRSIAKETLARLRSRSPRTTPKGQAKKKMPPAPDPYELDEEGRKIFPWPKSFAEIVQTACFSTMNLIMEGETRIEVCFPPLPLADLDWNICDLTETRVVDSNIQHAIAFAKLMIKDKRSFPQLNAEETQKKAMDGAPLQEPDKIKGLLERRFKKKPDGDLGRTDLPARGAARRFQLREGPALCVLRGKDGELYVTEDAVPPLRQPLTGHGCVLDGRLLRAQCRVFGTKFDLRNGEVMGPWCPLESSPLLLVLLLRLLLLLLRLLWAPGTERKLRSFRSRWHQGKLEVELKPSGRRDRESFVFAFARWLFVPSTELRPWKNVEVDLQVQVLKDLPDTQELKISVVPKRATSSELGRAFLRLPKSPVAQPQMAQLARELFALPKLKDSEARCAVWVAQYVLPEARGLGLDQKMLSKILEILHERGFHFLLLMVDGRSEELRAQLYAHYELQGFVKIAEPNAMGLQRAMLRHLRGGGICAAPGTSAEEEASGPVVEAARHGVDVAKNAFFLAHCYVCLPLLIEFVKMVPRLRKGHSLDGLAKQGPGQVLLRAMTVLGYVEASGDRLQLVECQELKAWETLLSEDLLELYEVKLPFDLSAPQPFLSLLKKLPSVSALQGEAGSLQVFLRAALLTPLAVSVVSAESAAEVRRGPVPCSRELDPLLRELNLGSCADGTLSVKALSLQRCQTLLVAASYAPMLGQFRHILHEDPSWAFAETVTGVEERHVDRVLNVLGSGLQHKAFFRDLLELLRPLFSGPLEQQPCYVADTGCGDGSLLWQIYEFVCSETIRGKHLKDHPLTMIGIDLNTAALGAAARTLREVPHQLLEADIGQPGRLVRELEHRGIDARRVLHVRSFLDHDRPFQRPERPILPGRRRGVEGHLEGEAYCVQIEAVLGDQAVRLSLTMELAQGEQKVSDSCQALKRSMEAVVGGIKKKRRMLDDVLEERLKLSCSADGKDEKATAKGSDVLKLNVGGDSAFQTRRDTLTAIEGSRLSQMFGGRWDKVLPKDKSGRFFLDRIRSSSGLCSLGWLMSSELRQDHLKKPSPQSNRCRKSFALAFWICAASCVHVMIWRVRARKRGRGYSSFLGNTRGFEGSLGFYYQRG